MDGLQVHSRTLVERWIPVLDFTVHYILSYKFHPLVMINFDLVPKSNDPPEFLKFSKISRSFFVSEINRRRRQRQRRQLPRLIASIRKKRKHRNHRWISRLNRSTIFSIDRRKWAGSGRVWLQSGYISVSRAGVRDVG